MAGPAAAGVRGERGVLWDGTIPSVCDRATIMGCLCTYGGLPPWEILWDAADRRQREGKREGVIMGCRCSPGRGRGEEVTAPAGLPGGARWAPPPPRRGPAVPRPAARPGPPAGAPVPPAPGPLAPAPPPLPLSSHNQ